MTLKELHKKLTVMMAVNETHAEDKVCVVTNERVMGGTPVSEVKSVVSGIDWDSGNLLLICSDKLIKQ